MSGPEARPAARRVSKIGRVTRGVSLIEMMVGIAVGLVITLAAIASSQLFMSRQRQSVDVGSALGNAITGLAAIQYEASHAGIGFFASGGLICPTMNLSVGSSPIRTNEWFSPINVRVSGSTTTIDIAYATALEAGAPSLLAAATTSDAALLAVSSYLPVVAGQALMLVPAPGGTRPCTVRTATAVTAATDTSAESIGTDSTGAANQFGFTSVAYDTTDSVMQLGTLRWTTFTLAGTDLTMTRPLSNPAVAAVTLAHNVMALRADYGIGDGVSNSLSAWQKVTGGWASLDPAHLPLVRALRVGIVVRSDTPEKKDASGACSATTTAPVMFGDAFDQTADTDWQCYRYRVDTITVPLRNFIMGTAP